MRTRLVLEELTGLDSTLFVCLFIVSKVLNPRYSSSDANTLPKAATKYSILLHVSNRAPQTILLVDMVQPFFYLTTAPVVTTLEHSLQLLSPLE